MENKKKHNANDAQADGDQGLHANSRSRGDRRSAPSRGYTYVSMVGWIDRRERKRRKRDPNSN